MSDAVLPEPQPIRLRDWVRDHDESWLFVVIYLGLAVGLSVFVSLFWLLVVAALHFLLEVFRQRFYRRDRTSVILHALWEVKLDIGLVLLALTLVLYIEVVLGLLGIQSAARAAAVSRAGVRIGSRAAAWERNLRTFLLTVDEMARVLHAGVMFRKRKKTSASGGNEGVEAEAEPEAPVPIEEAPEVPDPGPELPAWRRKWKMGDYFGMGLVAAGMVLIVLAPVATSHDWTTARSALLEELHPFPSNSAHDEALEEALEELSSEP